MGCDIHLYSETLKEGKWIADRLDTLTRPTPEEYEDGDRVDLDYSYHGGRDYALFGLLSEGVRYDVDFAFPQLGEPEGMAPEIKDIFDAWEGDAHSHSYITVAELKRKAMDMLIMSNDVAQALLPRLASLIEGLPKTDNPNPEEQRIVFFFDN